jgi:hypothetical protein
VVGIHLDCNHLIHVECSLDAISRAERERIGVNYSLEPESIFRLSHYFCETEPCTWVVEYVRLELLRLETFK